jgi:hypothetical protein
VRRDERISTSFYPLTRNASLLAQPKCPSAMQSLESGKASSCHYAVVGEILDPKIHPAASQTSVEINDQTYR